MSTRRIGRRLLRTIGGTVALTLAAVLLLPLIPAVTERAAAPITDSEGTERSAPAATTRPDGDPRSDLLSGLSVQIVLPTRPVDPGRPFNVTASLDGAVGTANFAWSDSLGGTASSPTFEIVAPTYGSVEIALRVTDAVAESASANASVSVGEFPSMSLSSSVTATDVGLPIPVALGVTGGFPPFAVTWQGLPSGSSGSTTLTGSSDLELSISGNVPGAEWLRVAVTDRLGAGDTIEAIVAQIHDDPSLILSPDPSTIDAGSVEKVSGLLLGGTAPFRWSAVADLPCGNVTGASGAVGPDAPIIWSARFISAGNATVHFEVEDAAGTPLGANATILVAPALSAVVAIETPTPSVGRPLNLSVDLSGGHPPYDYSFHLSDGEADQAIAGSAGPIDWSAQPLTAGFLTVTLTVSDALDGTVALTATTVVSPSGPPTSGPLPDPVSPPPAPTTARSAPAAVSGTMGLVALAAGAVLSLGLIGAAVVLFLRRRAKRRPDVSNDSEATVDGKVRTALQEADGVDRSVLEVLLAEEGIDAEAMDRSIQRLRADGRIRVEPGGEGGPTLHWKEESTPATGSSEGS